MPRSEEEILSGMIVVRLADADRNVPVLKIREAREWAGRLRGALGGVDELDVKSTQDIEHLATQVGEKQIDLILEYDRQDRLALTREQIEEQATPDEVYRAFRAMFEAAFPFVTDVGTLLTLLRGLQPVVSVPGNNTSGPSPNGDSTPKRSRVVSAKSS